MSKKEKTAKSYAQECYPYSEEMRMQCEQHYEAGWDKALESQWIKVEERTPNTHEEVLVLFEHEGEMRIETDVYYGDDFCNYYTCGVWHFGGEKILAWMPIPSFDDILAENKDVLKRLKEK